MTILKDFYLFVKRQVIHIHENGLSAFYQKGVKLLRLLFVGTLAPVAVYFKVDWPEAYRFVGHKFMKKYGKACLRPNPNRTLIEKIENKAVFCLRKYSGYKPSFKKILDWVDANKALAILFFLKGKIKDYIDTWKGVEGVRRDILEKHQLEKLDIEFIPRSFAIGNIGVYENLAVYVKAGMLGLRPPRKLILLLDPKSLVNNPCYLNYWRKYITIISDPLLIQFLESLEKGLVVPLNFYMPFHEKILMSQRAVGIVREQWIQEKRPPILTLSKEDSVRGWECLKSLDMPEGAWFVCLHARESGWNDNGFSEENFRNADIGTYLLSIKAVVDAGGWVVRIGDSSMTPLPEMTHVIDYAHSDAKNDWMDVFLCEQARFFIGTSSGMFGVAAAFGTPLVMTNFLAGQAIYYFSSQDIFITRICQFKSDNRVLSFKEVISPPIGMFSTQFYYDKFGIEVIENTPEEIRDVVMEMLMRFNGTLKYRQGDEDLQERFKTMIKSCSELYGDKNVVNARMGKDFLRKYAALLPDMEGSLC